MFKISKDDNLEWMKDGVVVSGKELYDKLKEWKILFNR